MLDSKSIDSETFDKWLQPRAARELLTHLQPDEATRAILGRIANDGLLTAARKTIRRRGQTTSAEAPYLLIPAGYWPESNAAQTWSSLWRFGDIDFTLHSITSGPDFRFACVDVRFDPDGIARLFPADVEIIVRPRGAAVVPPPIASKAEGPAPILPPKISSSALRAFISQFCESRPDAHFAEIRDAARRAHPNLRVTERPVKDAIADLNLTKSRGNPAITQKNR